MEENKKPWIIASSILFVLFLALIVTNYNIHFQDYELQDLEINKRTLDNIVEEVPYRRMVLCEIDSGKCIQLIKED